MDHRHPIPVDFSGLVDKIEVMGTEKMARLVNTCHPSARTGVQRPNTHANAEWAWVLPVIPVRRRQRRNF